MTTLRYLGTHIPESLCGMKAKRLDELASAGFAVPPGFCVGMEKLSASELSQGMQQIGGFPVAVRSSGLAEDLKNASFAGLYETYLDVSDEAALLAAIEGCLASAKSERVKDYLKQKGIEADGASMRVLVQKQVNAACAGVLFTLEPVEGKEELFYLEVCEGLGERLVSGHVTPSRYWWNWHEGILHKEEVNDEGTRLTLEQLQGLTLEALKIQAHYGRPQDIEWAFDQSGKLWILQSRPITQVAWREDVPELTNADLKDGGISARVCSPLMFSLYAKAMQPSMGGYFKKIRLIHHDEGISWLHHYYGRAYWNAAEVKRSLFKIPNFSEKTFDEDLGIQKDYGRAGAKIVPTNLITVLNALPVIGGLNSEFDDCERMVEEFGQWFETANKKLLERISEKKLWNDKEWDELCRDILNFQNITERNYFRTIYNNSNYQSEFKSMLRGLDPKGEINLLALMGELSGVAHLRIQAGLCDLYETARIYGFTASTYLLQRSHFLQEHYHHGDAELDLTVPRWGEIPERIDEMVRSLLDAGQAPYDPRKNSGQPQLTLELEKIEKMFADKLHWRLFGRRKFLRQLYRLRGFLTKREEMRTLSTRAYYLCRLAILESGKRLFKQGIIKAPEHIFLLTSDELTMKTYPTLDELQLRNFHYQGYRNFVPPNEFGGSIQQATQDRSSMKIFKGIGCSSGEIVARARVVLTLAETNEIQEGEILITKFTDPGWTPVLARVKGVVTEVGGVLSHAAVIGREYGIPAVLNLTAATEMIRTGSLIRVNGKSGEVEILEERS